MGITVGSYFSLYDKRAELARIYKKYGARAIFIVPARLDRDFMLELICGNEPGFGARPAVWTVGDLLLELQRATKEYERIIDPPDHKLILRWLLSEFLAEAEEKGAALEPGYSHAGFVSVLGENIKDLLAEEVSPGSLRSALGEEVGEYSPESVLIELYERYTEYLEDYGLADAAQIFTLARRKLLTDAGRVFVAGKKIVFAGFLSFTSSQLRLVKALGELADLTMLQPETGLDWFHDGILQLNEGYKGRPKWDVPVVKIDAGNPQLELEAVARELALWACGEGALTALGEFGGYGSVGLMTSPDRLHIAEYALSRYKIPYNVQEGRRPYGARAAPAGTIARRLCSSRTRCFSDGAASCRAATKARCQTAWRRGSRRCRRMPAKRCAARTRSAKILKRALRRRRRCRSGAIS